MGRRCLLLPCIDLPQAGGGGGGGGPRRLSIRRRQDRNGTSTSERIRFHNSSCQFRATTPTTIVSSTATQTTTTSAAAPDPDGTTNDAGDADTTANHVNKPTGGADGGVVPLVAVTTTQQANAVATGSGPKDQATEAATTPTPAGEDGGGGGGDSGTTTITVSLVVVLVLCAGVVSVALLRRTRWRADKDAQLRDQQLPAGTQRATNTLYSNATHTGRPGTDSRGGQSGQAVVRILSTELACAGQSVGRRLSSQEDTQNTELYEDMDLAGSSADDYVPVATIPEPDDEVYEAMSGPSLKLSREAIELGTTELGRGHYGVVLKGVLAVARDGAPSPTVIYSQGAGTPVPVAIKTLPNDKADEQPARDDLWDEIKIMCKVQSKGGDPNVVRFHGYAGRPESAARGEGPMLLVLEFASNGSLLGHLKKQRERGESSLPPQQLHKFAVEVASGMCFVAKIGMVHRDLAARNILLDDQMRCKITDFGLTRTLYSEDQYTANTGGRQSNPTAWAWTSLEGLTDGVFTTKGDVWSYGIVLTELCSLGQKPYVQSAAEIREFLQDGKRIEFSRRWPRYLCRLMAQCWYRDPSKRPSFPAMVNKLASNVSGESGGNAGSARGGTDHQASGANSRDSQGYEVSKAGGAAPPHQDCQGYELAQVTNQAAGAGYLSLGDGPQYNRGGQRHTNSTTA